MSSEESQERCTNSLHSNQGTRPVLFSPPIQTLRNLFIAPRRVIMNTKEVVNSDHIALHPSPDISNKWGTTIDTEKHKKI
jgi:hypothetical protein